MNDEVKTKKTAVSLREAKGKRKLTVLTAYDALFARLMDDEGIDVVLVGDSLGMVVQGQTSTLPVTMEQMIYHTSNVRRGVSYAHLVADMPFMSYQVSDAEAVRNAGRLVQEGGAESIKLEGGAEFSSTVKAIVRAGIPVMGHIGLLPQSVHRMGGYRVQGKTSHEAKRLIKDAQSLESAGAYALVLEGIPAQVTAEITHAISIPTIGIGAGPTCDGQVLVLQDMLGLTERRPRFAKAYADLNQIVGQAIKNYCLEVAQSVFPDESYSYVAGEIYGGKKSISQKANTYTPKTLSSRKSRR